LTRVAVVLAHVLMGLLVVAVSIAAFVDDVDMSNWVVLLSVALISVTSYLGIVTGLVFLYGKWGGDE
jgi:hypothetical protein